MRAIRRVREKRADGDSHGDSPPVTKVGRTSFITAGYGAEALRVLVDEEVARQLEAAKQAYDAGEMSGLRDAVNILKEHRSRSVAMQLTGHKTEAVYRRYAITCEADLREGVARLNDTAGQRTSTRESA